MKQRRRLIAVIGNGQAPEPVLALAEAVGRALVDAGFRVLSGGLGGVMEAASRGARSSAAYVDGDVVGIVPGSSSADANPHVDIVIVSGMGVGRNVLIAHSADGVVAVAGGRGHLERACPRVAAGPPHRRPGRGGLERSTRGRGPGSAPAPTHWPSQ